MNIPLPTIGDLEDDVSMELLLTSAAYTLSLMYNHRTGRWYYSVSEVQDNLAVGAPCPIPNQGVLTWSECPTGRDLTNVRLYLMV